MTSKFFDLSCLLFNEVSDGFMVLTIDTPYAADENSSFPPYLWTEYNHLYLGRHLGPKHSMEISIVSFMQAIQIVLA